MNNPKITIISADDWEGLYIDGELKDEGHSLQLTEVLKILGYTPESFEAKQDWLEDAGSLPKKLSDVQFQTP